MDNMDKEYNIDGCSNTNIGSAVLDSLIDNIAVLDRHGSIIFVNKSWTRFSSDNGGIEALTCIGVNYLDVCTRSAGESESAKEALDGIKDVISGVKDRFQFEYPCHSDTENRWFLLNVTPLTGSREYVVVSHINITDRKHMEIRLKESEERYGSLFYGNHSAMLLVDPDTGYIVDANPAACAFYLYNIEQLKGMSISNINMLSGKSVFKEMESARSGKIKAFSFSHRLADGSVKDVEVYSGPIWVGGKQLLYSIVHDISEQKKELHRAASIQRHRLSTSFPIDDRAALQSIYMPAKVVSGDFYQLYRINGHIVTGILGDVSGKGVTAALNVTALKVLFGDGALIYRKPSDILKYLNRQAVKHLEEEYIAACCFTFDFENRTACTAGAGINQFIYKSANGEFEIKTVKGPFLGMFENSSFEEKTIKFNAKDRFYFYTDGMDFIFDNKDKMNILNEGLSIKDIKKHFEDYLNKQAAIYDDCTWLGIEIK